MITIEKIQTAEENLGHSFLDSSSSKSYHTYRELFTIAKKFAEYDIESSYSYIKKIMDYYRESPAYDFVKWDILYNLYRE